jgi:tetratricopeptide (TPR) repeat protein
MNRRWNELSRRFQLYAALMLVLVSAGSAVADEDRKARAVELYDAGRYKEARSLLEALDGENQANGALLYRLYYCQRATGDGKLGTETLRRAVDALQREMETTVELEAGFYLAAGYESLGQRQEGLAVVETVLQRVEQGQLEAKSGVDRFRLGKLYADQGNELEAANWYRRAIQAFGEEGSGNSAYIAWASRYLADLALAMEDYSAAEIHLTDLVEHSQPSVEDLDRLAVARVRNGMFREAARAWGKSVPLSPALANRARYCARLAAMADRLDGLLEATPSGESWDRLSRQDFEELLKAQAARVREIRGEYAQAEGLGEPEKKQRQEALDETKKVFVTAGLEFALRGYDIREAAFLGGYAPLVFQSTEWVLEPEERQPKKPGRRKAKHAKRTGAVYPQDPAKDD